MVLLECQELKSVILGVNGDVIWLGVRLRTFVKLDKEVKILIIRLNI